MEIGETLYSKFSNTTGITGILGSTKIFPNIIPIGISLPALTYRQVSNVTIHASGKDPGLYRSRYQISSWSTSYDQVKELAKQTRIAIQDYTGSTWATIQRIFFDQEIDIGPDIDPQTKKLVHHTAQDFLIWWSS